MDYNKLFQSKKFKIVFFVIAGSIVFLLGLKAGTVVGFKKANFSCRWGENYQKNFAGPRRGFFDDLSGGDFLEAHGVFGQIIKIDGASIIMKGRNDVEKIVVVGSDTVIKSLRDTVKEEALKVGDSIVVIGEPNDAGQIEAKLIRIMPSPPMGALFDKAHPRPFME